MKVEVAVLGSLSLVSPYGLWGRKATLNLTPLPPSPDTVYIVACMHTCVCVCVMCGVCVYVWVCACACMCVCVCMHVHACVCANIQKDIYAYIAHTDELFFDVKHLEPQGRYCHRVPVVSSLNR